MAKVRYPVIDLALLVLLLIVVAFAIHYRNLAKALSIELSSRQSRDEQARDVADNFLNSCRLLSIHRNGRLNVFTFARRDQIFAVETMGLLSDNPDEWRKLAGLTQ